jgi:hypothetical protein
MDRGQPQPKTYADCAVQADSSWNVPKDEALECSGRVPALDLTPRRRTNLRKPAQLPYNRPSAPPFGIQQRITSFPETSPPNRIRDTHRVVSLQEPTLPNSPERSFNSDCQENFFESCPDTLSSVRIHDSFETVPSPPSSPESVMIIGNNIQVPPSLFRKEGFGCVGANSTFIRRF